MINRSIVALTLLCASGAPLVAQGPLHADEIDLLEWGGDPCRESWKSIAAILGVWCGPQRQTSLYGNAPAKRSAYVVVWPRG